MPTSSGPPSIRSADSRHAARPGPGRRVLPVLSSLVDFEHFEPQAFIADGDRVVVLGVSRSTVKGGSGRSFDESWCHVFTIRDGKVAKFYEYLDTAAFAASSRRQPHARNGSEPEASGRTRSSEPLTARPAAPDRTCPGRHRGRVRRTLMASQMHAWNTQRRLNYVGATCASLPCTTSTDSGPCCCSSESMPV